MSVKRRTRVRSRLDGERDVTRSAETEKRDRDDDDVRRSTSATEPSRAPAGRYFPSRRAFETPRNDGVRARIARERAVWEKRPKMENKEDAGGTRRGARRRTHLSGQAHELGRAPASVVGPDLRLHDDGAGSAPGRARASRGARATARAALTQQSRFFHPPRGRAQRSRVRSRGGERARGGGGGHRGRGSPRESPERRANAEAGIDPSRRTVARARRVKRLRLGNAATATAGNAPFYWLTCLDRRSDAELRRSLRFPAFGSLLRNAPIERRRTLGAALARISRAPRSRHHGRRTQGTRNGHSRRERHA